MQNLQVQGGTTQAVQPGPAIEPAPNPEVGETPQQEQNYQSEFDQKNLAEKLSEDTLLKIGQECKKGFEIDVASRKEWDEQLADWIKLASQVREMKNFPWPNASNVKFPLMGIAAMQFSARAYPSLVPSSGRIVSTKTYGKDPDGKKAARAKRVSVHMSWQILEEMDDWEEGMDNLLMQVAVTGNMYKKTYYDPEKDRNCSRVIGVENLVVNYWTRKLDEAERISEIIPLYAREVKHRQRSGYYVKGDLSAPTSPDRLVFKENTNEQADEKTTPYQIIEQHTWLQLPDDDFEKPYVVTFERQSGKVLRVSPRFDLKNVKRKDGKVVYIGPYLYYTKFGFIPNPDGSFYDIGFGHLLGPLNESVNTLVNLLIDSGTINNLQSGFLGKGLRVKGGDYNFEPGEWKWVNATGDDLKKQIMPLPTKEPSKTLFDLLQYLVGAGKELASIAEIFVGKMPGQNTPATTTQSSIEQGMKVFTAIYKRIYRSLTQEFIKLYRLNGEYLDPNTEVRVLDEPIGPGDYNTDDYDIYPAADPTASSQQERLSKAQAVLQMLPIGTIDPGQATIRMLDAMEIPNFEQLIPGMAQTGQPAPPPPDPKQLEMKMKMEAEQQKSALRVQESERKMELDTRSKETELAMKAQEHHLDLQAKAEQNRLQAQADEHKQKIFMQQTAQTLQANQATHQQDLAHKAQTHAQAAVHQEQTHRQTQRHAEAESSQKLQSAKAQSKIGNKTPSRK